MLALAFGLVGYGVVWVIEREGHAASVCGAAAVAAVEHEAAPRTLIVAWSGLRSGVVTGVLLPLDFGSASISYACQARWSPLGGWTGIVSRRVE